MSKTRHALSLIATPLAIACLCAILAALCFARPAWADEQTEQLTQEEYEAAAARAISYLPDVTSDMAQASFWSNKQSQPDAILADRALIDQLNQAGVDADGTMLQPLREASERFYTAEEQLNLKNSAAKEMADLFINQVYDEDGVLFTQEYADQVLANYPTDGARPDIASGFAIVTTHTTMRVYPTDRPLMYTKTDPDDDNLYLSALRVNEPLLVRARSVDGKFLLCISSCLTAAWVPAQDVAICKDRAEWLAAWDIPAGKELVVCGYKVRTEQTRVTPHIANRMLYMGTVLERVDGEDPTELVGTRSAYNNHVCYLPVRNEDGTYSKELALIAESEYVSEGYLPLTKANIATVALRSLGQMYGWGGMLEANDCSGYVRDVYKCFGLELARNTTWQMNLPVRKYDLTNLDDAHKAAAIAQMPLGTVLFWGSHEMLYLGQDNGKLYVISATGGLGNLFDTEGSFQVKGVIINTLDVVRGNRNSWLSTLTTANIPYIPATEEGPGLYDLAFYENAITWPAESYPYTGSAIEPGATVSGLVAGQDYTVSYSNNVNPGEATVTITGSGAYSGSLSRTFKIEPAPAPIWMRLSGDNAYGTMDAIVTEGWDSAETVVIATFDGYWDALAASALAGKNQAPILLTGADALNETTAQQIKRLGAKKALIVGGPVVIPDAVKKQIEGLGLATERYWGADAQETAIAIANQVAPTATTCIIATSATFHDALAASPLAYAKGYPIYLTDDQGVLHTDTLAAIEAGGFSRAIIAGGAAAIPTHIESDLASLGIGTLERRWGETAIGTSKALAELAIAEGMSANHMGVATAGTYYDALTGGPLCGKNNGVLVLAADYDLSNTALPAAHKDDIKRAYMFGGPAALSEAVFNAFEATTKTQA